MASVLVTGANGFIGRRLLQAGTRAMVRRALPVATTVTDSVIADITRIETLTAACHGIDTIFHCAGYAHAFASASAERHYQVNQQGTCNLLQAAAEAGVRRFVHLSSVKAMAEPGRDCVDEDWPGLPLTDYGRAKLAAEQAVLQTGARHGMHVVNLRLSMVYGNGGRGNLERMARAIAQGWFPPLPDTGAQRSLVHVDDVVRVMRLVASQPQANGKTYIVSAAETYTTRQLYDALRSALGLAPRRWQVPPRLLRAAGCIGDGLGAALGRTLPLNSEVLSRLLDPACYSAGRLQRELQWRSSVSLAEGLREMLGPTGEVRA
jgi:nucleoside-diphosphate-sugar epimerase